MSGKTTKTLEIIFFIVSFVLVLQDPTALLDQIGNEYFHIVKPVLTTWLLLSVPMIYTSAARILDDGRLFTNLLAGTVYFVNIIKWIEVI